MRTNNLTIGLLCLFFLIIGVCVSLNGCEKGKVGEYAGFVEGTVIDSLTRLPIDSAWLRISPDTLDPLRTYTNSAGYYFFTVGTGMYPFHYCGKNGYVSKKSREYEIKKKQTTRIDFELVPLGE